MKRDISYTHTNPHDTLSHQTWHIQHTHATQSLIKHNISKHIHTHPSNMAYPIHTLTHTTHSLVKCDISNTHMTLAHETWHIDTHAHLWNATCPIHTPTHMTHFPIKHDISNTHTLTHKTQSLIKHDISNTYTPTQRTHPSNMAYPTNSSKWHIHPSNIAYTTHTHTHKGVDKLLDDH